MMISRKRLEEQLKRINFHYEGWGRSEVHELCNIIMSDEEIEECVNGYYEAGFALLVSTKDRVLLVDKKPLGYLTVEDMRFDMINELDLHKRLLGAQIKISAGAKTLLFTSLNQARLSRVLAHVQARMTQIKKDASEHQSAQKMHLEEMNEQLRLYLMAAHKQQYIDQANAIQSGHAFGQPISPQQSYQQFQSPPQFAQPMTAPQYTEPAVQPLQQNLAQDQSQEAAQPKTPFEQAALLAFEHNSAASTDQPTESMRSESAKPEPERPRAHILTAVPHYSQQALAHAGQIVMTPQQIGLAAARRVVPIISAYTRLPLMSQRRRYRTSQAHGPA
jgi:hypothetical protein